MSDGEETATAQKGWKKKRLQGACDACSPILMLVMSQEERRITVRCDSANMPGNQCSNCLAFNIPCTRSEPTKKRGPKSPYVENLEMRVKGMEAIIRKLSPDFNLEEVGNAQSVSESPAKDTTSPLMATLRPSSMSSTSQLQVASPTDGPLNQSTNDDEEDDFTHIELAKHMKKLSLKCGPDIPDFFGPASSFRLLHNAYGHKADFIGKPMFETGHNKRRDIWTPQPWELAALSCEQPAHFFPENDLLVSLISLYFSQVNCYLPLLHAPTVKRLICEGYHYKDHKFGNMVLALCALASRFSDDPRVFVDPQKLTSAGWKYFRQVKTLTGMTIERPTMYDLQTFCLVTLYLTGSSYPQASWALLGIAIRFAEELGYHRRKPEGLPLTPELEQQKRVFWVLVILDRCVSNFTGRPTAIREEDYDQEFPVDCDDEYWETPDPSKAFTQPPNKPSSVSCFIFQIKLCEILGFALRMLFPTKKSKVILGLVGNDWEQKIISELDSSLNNWINTIPDHLRWNVKQENTLFFNQSAFLHSMYYNVQIQTHRPFIQKPSSFTLPSLAICTNAARSCINVVHRHSESGRGHLVMPQTFFAAFASGIVLLTNIWSSKSTGIKFDIHRELTDVSKVMRYLGSLEARWVGGGRFMYVVLPHSFDLQLTQVTSHANIVINVLKLLLSTVPPPTPPPLPQLQPSPLKPKPNQSLPQQPIPQPQHQNNWETMSSDSPPSLPFSSQELGARPFGLDLSSAAKFGTGTAEVNANMIFGDVDETLPIPINPGGGGGGGAVYTQQVTEQLQSDADMTMWFNTLGDQSMETMWTSAPSGFGVDEWGSYVESYMSSMGTNV
ncbi:Gypsy retrotransposon integrase-like protein 1 [Paramarasmius palmivorus]|uniref:Gypsy retrotransposon integrase-like protein 1 n=1 Tax=Paramarasmius palmivorus TaxID=297713 RepID=A0AAW0DNX0_9AGAR